MAELVSVVQHFWNCLHLTYCQFGTQPSLLPLRNIRKRLGSLLSPEVGLSWLSA